MLPKTYRFVVLGIRARTKNRELQVLPSVAPPYVITQCSVCSLG